MRTDRDNQTLGARCQLAAGHSDLEPTSSALQTQSALFLANAGAPPEDRLGDARGVVPDPFSNPVEILALFAWDNKPVDVTDVVETQKSQYTQTLLAAFCYDSAEKRRSYYAVPYTGGLD